MQNRRNHGVFALASGSRIVAVAVLAVAALSGSARAVVPAVHIVNGGFDPNEWEPARSTISKSFFGVSASGKGGAFLYAEQATGGAPGTGFGSDLHLMYDFVNSPNGLGGGAFATNSYFDVFFEIHGSDDDYAVRIRNGLPIFAFEKPHATPSPLNADGTLHITNPSSNVPVAPWSNLPANEAALANFQGALGFSSSPNSGQPHLMAEFSLTIEKPGLPGSGFYSPDPAFWSAAAKGPNGDPPISSGLFDLNIDGTTTVFPQLLPDGSPSSQQLPEPASLTILTIAASGMLARRRS